MSRLSRHSIPTVALILISFGAFTQQALAEPENCSARFNHCIRDGEKHGSFNACNRAEQACEGRNRDHRHPAGAASGHEGGVTVTQTSRTAGSGSSSGGSNRKQK